MSPVRLGSSFRDPSGFVYEQDGILLRQVNSSYEADFKLLRFSGLQEELEREGLLVATELESPSSAKPGVVAVQRPKKLDFISYPYEWSFSALKDAALATLEIQDRAIAKGMSLKDASAFNIQFDHGKPTLIDTLSFEKYVEGSPWIAYRQFCRHFLAPLALMAHTDIRLSTLSQVHLDGVPLDLASGLLPKSTCFGSLLFHLHLHGKVESNRKSPATSAPSKSHMSKTAMRALVSSLRQSVEKLNWTPQGTVWGDYYSDTNYSESAMRAKHDLVRTALKTINRLPKMCWDLGANNGEFSRISATLGITTIAWDVDPAAVEKGYRYVKKSGETKLLPLLQDLTNPSPNLGWAGEERNSLLSRGPADVVLALALIHHMAIGNNVPLALFSEFLAKCGRFAIVEFVPKEDSQVARLLSSRKDVFPTYTQQGWEEALGLKFSILKCWPLPDSKRTLYLLARK